MILIIKGSLLFYTKRMSDFGRLDFEAGEFRQRLPDGNTQPTEIDATAYP